jgi:TonB family protein
VVKVLNIFTLAAWLTFSAASAVCCLVKVDYWLPALHSGDLEIKLSDVFDMDTDTGMVAAGSAAPGQVSNELETVDPLPSVMPIEAVPEIPELTEIDPLPEIPELPEIAPKADALKVDQPKAAQAKVSESAVKATRSGATATRAGADGARGVSSGIGGGTGIGNGSAAAGAARLSKGRTPRPPYPPDCRARNEEGRVGITFTVDEAGNVVAAKISSPSPYPSMNQAALNGVYRWKFPAGPRITASRAIVFQLK